MENIIEQIDAEISKLQEARAVLTGATMHAVKSRRGRPKGSTDAPKLPAPTTPKRGMSAEGKARVAAAQKKRWAAVKRAAKKAAAVAA